MSRKKENTSFSCGHCLSFVHPLSNGSFRNHCPVCLYSKHVDEKPGDRNSKCKGLMKPIGIRHNSRKGLQIIHQCTICNVEKVNKIAEFDHQSDNINAIIKLM
ncbi:RNHCP domain-containing protein [Chengkuizengella axinellae]|uniref:RNHCP domain-containing protein n=1 Tax=Chengkuizengella axinellae TaxID=3064388 RepID=A0ABT9IX32_9BACL|nr:RNHCP domain-containing protein [Chengkuizengella sp. 2205SS18-9]MDP5273924.1 RNHCP domain-containing protein [Chengkuizengella sp. 2205SS18-9]